VIGSVTIRQTAAVSILDPPVKPVIAVLSQ
jgi:hypothetical protein